MPAANPNWSPIWRSVIAAAIGSAITCSAAGFVFYGQLREKIVEIERLEIRIDRMDRDGTMASKATPPALTDLANRTAALERSNAAMARDVEWIRAWLEKRDRAP